MTLARERAIVELAHRFWADGDLDGFITCLSEDVVYTVNVDGVQVPYAASAVGREAVRQRFQILLDTLWVQAFVIESLIHDKEFTRSWVLAYYKHKRTGERLDIKVRFHGYVRDGRLCRIEEYHDAPYVEAFQRFVAFLEADAADRSYGAADGQNGAGME